MDRERQGGTVHGGLSNIEPMVLVGAGRQGEPGVHYFANTDVRPPALALTNWTGSPPESTSTYLKKISKLLVERNGLVVGFW